MGRSENISVPCRVSIDELAHDRGEQEFSAEDLKEAREEIVDGIIGNTNGLGGVRLWHVLQGWLNVDGRLHDERLSVIAKNLQTLLNGAPVEYDPTVPYAKRREMSVAIARCDARAWLEEIVNEYISDEMVEERAAKIAAERLEDAS